MPVLQGSLLHAEGMCKQEAAMGMFRAGIRPAHVQSKNSRKNQRRHKASVWKHPVQKVAPLTLCATSCSFVPQVHHNWIKSFKL
mmetsp:Transcript_23901/g.32238  ORF Transcript_23901/g.32238 Transcript_23901/m.32238 type:complete len:84 (+) Transcript_23901:476-727(+)